MVEIIVQIVSLVAGSSGHAESIVSFVMFIVSETIKRERNKRIIYECRCLFTDV